MFAFNIILADLFYKFENIFFYFINRTGFFIGICIEILIVRLKIRKVGFMFAFNAGFAKLFYRFEVILHYFIKSFEFVVGIYIKIFIIRLKIKELRLIVRVCCFFKVNSIYQFRGLDYFCIVNITKTIMTKPSL